MKNKIEKTANVFRWGFVYLGAVAFGGSIWAMIELARIFTTG